MNFKRFTFYDEDTGLSGKFTVPIVPSNIETLTIRKPYRDQSINEFIGDDVYRFAHYISLNSMVWKTRGASVGLKMKVKNRRIRIRGYEDYRLDPYLGTAGKRDCGLYRIGSTFSAMNECTIRMYLDNELKPLLFYACPSGAGDFMQNPYPSTNALLGGGFNFLAMDENWEFYNISIGTNFGVSASSKFVVGDMIVDHKGIPEQFKSYLCDADTETVTYESEVGKMDNIDTNTGVKWDKIEARFAPVAQTLGVAMYKMTKEQVRALFRSLYRRELMENIRSFLGGAKVEEAISSLTFYYHWGNIIKTSDETVVQVYDQTLDAKSGAEVRGKRITSEYAGNEMGTFYVKPIYGNFLDYSPYTSFLLNIPMYGAIELNASDIMARTVKIRYIIDISKNIGMIFVNIVDGSGAEYGYKKLRFTPGVDIPVNVASSGTGGLLPILAGVGGGAIGGAIGGPVGVAVGSSIGGALSGVLGSSPQYTHFSGGSSGYGYLDVFEPSLIRIYPKIADDGNSPSLGRPVAKTGRIGDFSGYVKTGNITSIGGAKYKDKIEALLKEGVFV